MSDNVIFKILRFCVCFFAILAIVGSVTAFMALILETVNDG